MCGISRSPPGNSCRARVSSTHFLIVLLRLTGKRQIGQLAPFDLVLLLALFNAVQNSMNGETIRSWVASSPQPYSWR